MIKLTEDKKEKDQKETIELISQLKSTPNRGIVLAKLNEKRDTEEYLAELLWHYPGTVAILLEGIFLVIEIVSVYPHLMQRSLSKEESDQIFAVLGLFQCIAMNSNTRSHFLKANLPLYFYPLINTQVKHKFYDHLKLSSLGVIGALVKGDDSNAIKFIMNTEMIVLCLR